MKTTDILDAVEKFAPPSLAYDWDNVGLLCGRCDKEIKKVMVTLDTDYKIVSEAVKNGCDMILSHHPILFGAIKKIDYSTADGLLVKALIENDMPLIAAHTNMDTAPLGINYALAQAFGLCDVEILDPHTNAPQSGLGRIGVLKSETVLNNFAEIVKTVLKTPCVRICGDLSTPVKKIAVASGSCSEVIPLAKAKDCDVIITGDMKYHEAINNTLSGICIIDAGHYPTETIVMDIFEKIIRPLGAEVYKSENKDIFQFV